MLPVPVTPDTAAELALLIQANLGFVGTVKTVERDQDGVNGRDKASHLIVTIESAAGALQKCGLKQTARLGRIDEGALCELAMSDFALSLGAPNACRTVRVTAPPGLPIIGGQEVCLIQWNTHSTPLARLERIEKDALVIGPNRTFYRELGMWVCFGLVFGVMDRHPGNWVWNHATQQLVMIDHEDAFGTSVVHGYNWIPATWLPADTASRTEAVASAMDGFRAMQARIADGETLSRLVGDHNIVARRGTLWAGLERLFDGSFESELRAAIFC